MGRKLFNLIAILSAIVAATCAIIAIGALIDCPIRRGVGLGWYQQALYAVRARWIGLDLRAELYQSVIVVSGANRFVPPRSVTLWPAFVCSLILPILWIRKRRRLAARGFEVEPAPAQPSKTI